MKKTIAWMLALCLLAMGIPAMAASSAQPAVHPAGGHDG